jgi:hypothetical protein
MPRGLARGQLEAMRMKHSLRVTAFHVERDASRVGAVAAGSNAHEGLAEREPRLERDAVRVGEVAAGSDAHEHSLRIAAFHVERDASRVGAVAAWSDAHEAPASRSRVPRGT